MEFDPRKPLESTEAAREQLINALVDNSLSVHSLQQQTPESLPRRALAPGNYSDLYRVYAAECLAASQPAASASTFMRVLRVSGWRDKIKFRGKSQHAQCATCHRLKSNIRSSKDLRSHALAADIYMRHLAGVFADRNCYEQSKRRSIQQRDMLCVIVDSMDKSKFSLPRYFNATTPKSLETKKRADLEVTAVICHGYGLYTFVADPDQASGSDWTHEVLARALDKAFKRSQKKNQPWPRVCRLFSDNTPKESWFQLLLDLDLD